ncbi:MAG: manganese efflux pump [Oscillospiraceae bacterium]|nr:manganese efflux pump [Oscillospiraceae bacterium]
MFQACLLALAVCMDTFFASAGCSMNGIFISRKCALLVSAVGTAFLTLSLSGAQFLTRILPEPVFRYAGFFILLLLGSSQIMKEMLTVLFRRHRPHWNWKALGLVIDVCFDETLADADHSKTLSMRETLVYSASLSLDSLASGISAGIQRQYIPLCLFLTFFAGFLLTLAGVRLGRFCHTKHPLSWLGGLMLLILALCRLFCST